jgi:hypothetical protein
MLTGRRRRTIAALNGCDELARLLVTGAPLTRPGPVVISSRLMGSPNRDASYEDFLDRVGSEDRGHGE